VAEKGHVAGISGDAACVLNHPRSALLDALRQFGASIESMHLQRHGIASPQIVRSRPSHTTLGSTLMLYSTLHARKWFPDIEAQPGIERQRAIVKRCLYEPNSSSASLARAIENCIHQLPSGAKILCAGIDGDRAHAGNRGTLIETVAAHDTAIRFSDHTVEVGAGKHHRHQTGRNLRPREITRKAMPLTDCEECVVTNLPAHRRIFNRRGSHRYIRFLPRRHQTTL
jgi:hypothetical protein